jgi:membrane protease YdiL (CAAX protease family)
LTDELDQPGAPPYATSQPPPPTGPPIESPPPEVPRPWGPARVLGGLAFFLVVLIVEAGIVAAFDSDISSLGARLALQGLLALTLIATALLFASPNLRRFAPAAELGLRRPLRSPYASMAIAYFGYIAVAILIAALLQPEQEDVTRDLGFGEGLLGSTAAALLIIVAAPLSEEMFFRGFMFKGLRRSVPFVIAALISSVVWGLFHYTGPGSWGVVLQLSIFGMALAWLYERTGSIWPTIAVHALNNAIAFALLTS